MLDMAADHPPRYYRVRNGRAFWEPGKFAAAYGFEKSQPLGEDGAAAKSEALKWNERLDEARKARREGRERKSRYKPGTLGAFYEAFQQTEAWEQMEPRTREDYARAWPHIEKQFGHVNCARIHAADSEAFHVDIHPAHKANRARDPHGKRKLPWNTAHRVLKVWRSLLTSMVLYGVRPAPAPVGKVTNPAPVGRSAVWTNPEVLALIEAATALELHGMAVAIRLAWDAMLSPVDVRLLHARQFLPGEISTQRHKTSRPVRAAVTDEADAAVAAYLERLEAQGVKLDADALLIRGATGAAYEGRFGRKYFERDFRAVREAAFPGDRRQFLDLRRSAITEARMGGAQLDDLGASAANNLGADRALQSTYIQAASKKVLDARQSGRAAMTAKFRKAEN